MAELTYGTIPEIKKQLEILESKEDSKDTSSDTVTVEDIALVVSRWTGVPVTKLIESEVTKLTHLEDELKKRVI